MTLVPSETEYADAILNWILEEAYCISWFMCHALLYSRQEESHQLIHEYFLPLCHGIIAEPQSAKN